ncbi:MAG TPA: hypothetical protein DEH78_03630 [Solibacterales bacterium]|nr:hypothetical protein [Bryobacterales bacterium]
MIETQKLVFTCSICGDPSTELCVWCTKDACDLHRCQRCARCSDCCECEIPLEDHPEFEAARPPVLALEEESEAPEAETDAPAPAPPEEPREPL